MVWFGGKGVVAWWRQVGDRGRGPRGHNLQLQFTFTLQLWHRKYLAVSVKLIKIEIGEHNREDDTPLVPNILCLSRSQSAQRKISPRGNFGLFISVGTSENFSSGSQKDKHWQLWTDGRFVEVTTSAGKNVRQLLTPSEGR